MKTMRTENPNAFFDELKIIGKLINEGQLVVDDIPLYRGLKIDLAELKKIFSRYINEIALNPNPDGIICSIANYLENSQSTFLSPAYFLNNYLDIISDYTVEHLNKRTKSGDYGLFINISTINIQSVFISIKCLLDRLVPIISYYYKGIPLNSTFGRIDKANKSKGLMSRIVQDKENDGLFQYIYEQYDEWIKDIVVPRDIVMHYNDMGLREQHTVDGRIVILHVENKIFGNEKDEDISDLPMEHYYKSIAKDVNLLYMFYNKVFGFLRNKEIIYTKHHFISEDLYMKYMDMRKIEISNSDDKFKMRCRGCGRVPEEINEYINSAKEEEEEEGEVTPTQYVIKNDGTYSKVTKDFLCTECYINEIQTRKW